MALEHGVEVDHKAGRASTFVYVLQLNVTTTELIYTLLSLHCEFVQISRTPHVNVGGFAACLSRRV